MENSLPSRSFVTTTKVIADHRGNAIDIAAEQAAEQALRIPDDAQGCHAIRSSSNPLGKTIPILAMTANAFLEDMQQSRDAGMDEHLSKPVDMAVLEQTVRRFRSTPPRNRK